MSSPVSAVLFDFGLVLSGPPNPAAWQRMHQALALDPDHFHQRYWARRHDYDRGALTGDEFWQNIAAVNGSNTLSSAALEHLLAADVDLWTDINQPMLDWAQHLQRRGIMTGILSNMGDRMTSGLLNKLDWLGAFDHHTWSYAVRLAKPESEIYRHATEGLRTPPDRILFIDDKAENITAAREAGLQAIQYTAWPDFLTALHEGGYGGLLEGIDTSQKQTRQLPTT